MAPRLLAGEVGTYLAQRRLEGLRPRTLANQEAVLERFQRCLGGHREIDSIRREDVDRYVEHRMKGRAAATVNVDIRTLRTFWKWAWPRAPNPMTGIRELRVAGPESKEFLEGKEIAILLRELGPAQFPVVWTGLKTGLRKGELWTLSWSNVDMERRILRIPAAGAKTRRERWVPFDAEVAELLGRIRNGTSLVFPNRDGKPRHATSGSFNRDLQKAARRAGIRKRVTLRMLRDSYASHLAMAGVPLIAISKLLGHSSIKTTEIYAHLAPDYLRAEAEALPIRFGPIVEKDPGE